MSKFELFCMIFYVLDADWDETKDEIVGEYLSSANPFLFSDENSADPTIFINFCETINDDITTQNSYSLAQKYIDTLNCNNIKRAFSSITEEEWQECVFDYLSQNHKGSN